MRIARAFLHCLRRCEPELLESIVGNLERPRGQRRRPRGQRQLQRKLSHGRVGWPRDWLGAATTSPALEVADHLAGRSCAGRRGTPLRVYRARTA